MRRFICMAAAIAFAAVSAPTALAATATPFGGATVSDGILTLVSNTADAGTTNDASGASFTGTGVTTFSSITTLSTEFDVTDDDCKAGSPRFQVRVQTPAGEKNVFVYLGPPPSFTGCSPNVWIASGNLIGSTDARYDTSQVQPGTQVSTYAQALALVGSYQVTGISLVVDSSFAFTDKEQTVRIRNVRINASTFFTGDDDAAVDRRPESVAGVQEAALGDGRRRVPHGLRDERQRRQRVRQVRLGDGADEDRQGARDRGEADRRLRRLVHAAVGRREEGQGQGEGAREAVREVPHPSGVTRSGSHGRGRRRLAGREARKRPTCATRRRAGGGTMRFPRPQRRGRDLNPRRSC